MRTASSDSNQYLVGFASGIVVVAVTALALQGLKWIRENQGSYIDLLTAPMFSFLDMFALAAILLMAIVVIVAPRYMLGGLAS